MPDTQGDGEMTVRDQIDAEFAMTRFVLQDPDADVDAALNHLHKRVLALLLVEVHQVQALNPFLLGEEHMPDCPATTPPFTGSCTCPKEEDDTRVGDTQYHKPLATASENELGPTVHEIPRRAQLNRFTPTEWRIYEAIQAVEAMPADVRLTDAVVLLQAARDSVADYVDGVEARRFVQHGEVREQIASLKEQLQRKGAAWAEQMMRAERAEAKLLALPEQREIRQQDEEGTDDQSRGRTGRRLDATGSTAQKSDR